MNHFKFTENRMFMMEGWGHGTVTDTSTQRSIITLSEIFGFSY